MSGGYTVAFCPMSWSLRRGAGAAFSDLHRKGEIIFFLSSNCDPPAVFQMSSTIIGDTSRNFVTIMNVTPYKSDGIYYASLTFESNANEEHLNVQLADRIVVKAKAIGGTLVSTLLTYPTPILAQYNLIFWFQNKIQLIYFTQGIGYPQESRSIYFVYDSYALSLLP
jgi:hypothetical protein